MLHGLFPISGSPSWRPLRSISVPFIVAIGSVIALASCNGEHAEKGAEGGQARPAPRSVAVTHPQATEATRYLYATGTAKALESVDLTARVAGYLKSIDYRDGAEVKAGQRLFLIEPDQYEAQVQQAQASMEQAQASLDNAQTQLSRQEELMQSSTTTQASLDNARSTRDTSQAQFDAAKASLKEAQINLTYTSVVAPFDGFVTEHQADVGALVGSGSPTTLATIVRLDPIHVAFSISDSDMLRLRKQAREKGLTAKDVRNVAVEAATKIDQDYPYKGRIDYLAPQTDAETGTLAARAVFDNASRDLLPNLFVRLRIPVGTAKDAMLVDPASIGTDQLGRFVLVVKPDGTVERRSVTLLDRSGDLQQVEGSLSPKDWVVRNALAGARAGEVVTIQPASAPGSTSGATPQKGGQIEPIINGQ